MVYMVIILKKKYVNKTINSYGPVGTLKKKKNLSQIQAFLVCLVYTIDYITSMFFIYKYTKNILFQKK